MSKKVSPGQKGQAIAYVSGLLSDKELLEFEAELKGNDPLQNLINDYQTTLQLMQDAFNEVPTEEQLQGQRLLLQGRLKQLESERSTSVFGNVGARIKYFFTTPQPTWVVIAYVLAAVLISRFLPLPFADQSVRQHIALDLVDLLKTNELRDIKLAGKTNGNGHVYFAMETSKKYDIRGGINDPVIQQLLYYLLLNDENPGKRLKALKLLKEAAPQLDATAVLVSSLLTDENPGVRLRSIELLDGYNASEMIIDACIKTLLEDENEAVRQKALDIIARHPAERSLPVLRIVSAMDNNKYIRIRATQTYLRVKEAVNPQRIEVQR